MSTLTVWLVLLAGPLGAGPRERDAGPIANPTPRDIPLLILQLKDKRFRQDAMNGLIRIGRPAVPALVDALRDRDMIVRVWAAEALVRIQEPQPAETVPVLIEAMEDQRAWVRINAAIVLGEMGPEAGDAIPVLAKALNDPSSVALRDCAAEAIWKIHPASVQHAIGTFVIGMALTLVGSLAAILYVGPFLRRFLVDLCGKEERVDFWSAFLHVPIVVVPLTVSMFEHTKSDEHEVSLFFDVASQLRWSMIGLAGTLIAIGLVLFVVYAHQRAFQ